MSRINGKLNWTEPEDTYWYSPYRHEHPEIFLDEDFSLLTRWTIAVSTVASFALAISLPTFINVPSMITLVVGLLVLIALSLTDFFTDLPVKLLVFCILIACIVSQATPTAPLFCPLLLAIGLTITAFCNSVTQEFIWWLLSRLSDHERTFFSELFQSRKSRLSQKDLEWLLSLAGESREAWVRKNSLSTTCRPISRANAALCNSRSRLIGSFVVVYGISLTLTTIVSPAFYWAQFFLLPAIGFLYLSSYVPRVPDRHFDIYAESSSVDNECALRLWFSTSRERIALYVLFLALTTFLIVRPSCYFPILISGTHEAARAYLIDHEMGHRDGHVDRFLSARPENWIIANWHAAKNGDPSRAMVLVPSSIICLLVPRAVANAVSNSLIKPVVAEYAHWTAYAEEKRRYGTLRELTPQDMNREFVNSSETIIDGQSREAPTKRNQVENGCEETSSTSDTSEIVREMTELPHEHRQAGDQETIQD